LGVDIIGHKGLMQKGSICFFIL